MDKHTNWLVCLRAAIAGYFAHRNGVLISIVLAGISTCERDLSIIGEDYQDISASKSGNHKNAWRRDYYVLSG
ncbi:hypothetical protein DLL90_15160 [Salmonella enterica subsp. enterica serovar Arechavaleta]|nr:hypothetical protein [Salmonella enterica subsp. enterica serovar Arechavaleta]EBI3941830.1 hypothetical protein [Salmonella enterica]EBL2098527.1 hypothetical protein [Salmonella enterica]EBO6756606.1 hypothetical protein [Salmonella enterica]EBS0916911.1 hypothetical protein [Salmonella enterica subsp. enterica serovar Arechavaleta]